MTDDGIACGYGRTMYSHETKLRQMVKARTVWRQSGAKSHSQCVSRALEAVSMVMNC